MKLNKKFLKTRILKPSAIWDLSTFRNFDGEMFTFTNFKNCFQTLNKT